MFVIIKVTRFMMMHDKWETIQKYKNHFDFDNQSFILEDFRSKNSISNSFEQQSWLKLIKKIVDRYIIRDLWDSIKWMLNLQIYKLHIYYQIITKRTIDWIEKQIVYKKLQFIMTQLRSIIYNTIETMKTQLFQNLMFIKQNKNISMISWSTLRNDISNQFRKWNFIQNQKNHWSMNKKRWLRNRIENIKAIKS